VDVIQVSGAGFAQTGTTCGAALAAGTTCDVDLTFTPTSVGVATGSLLVRSQGVAYTAQLSGAGASQLTVQLAGDGTGTVTSSPAGIACGASCTAPFTGSVQLTAVPASGSVLAGWSDPTCSGTTCTLAMSATARTITASFTQHAVFVSPGVYDFGVVDTTTGPSGTLQLVNQTSTTLSIDAVSVTPGPFSLASTTCGITLGANASCDIVVRFAAGSLGAQTATLDVTTSGSHHTAQITGDGALPVDVIVVGDGTVTSSPVGIACGATCSALFTAPVTLTAAPGAGYMLGAWSDATCGAGPTCTLAPGARVTATFSPTGPSVLTVAFPP
jgi:hypothetical protein